MREAGAEGIEMVMWLIMRGPLEDQVQEVDRFYTAQASNTAVGHIILENGRPGAGRVKPPAARQVKRTVVRKRQRPTAKTRRIAVGKKTAVRRG